MGGETKMLSRDEILASDDLRVEEVYVPEWGGTVRVRALSARDREILREAVTKPDGDVDVGQLRVRLVIMATVDAGGEKIFTLVDYDALQEKDAGAIDRIFAVAKRLSKLTPSAMEEIEGNSPEGQSDSSRSD